MSLPDSSRLSAMASPSFPRLSISALCFALLFFLGTPSVSARISASELFRANSERLLATSLPSFPALGDVSVQVKQSSRVCPNGYRYNPDNGMCVRHYSKAGIIIRIVVAVISVLFFALALFFCFTVYRKRRNTIVLWNRGTWQPTSGPAYPPYASQSPYPVRPTPPYPTSSGCDPHVQMGVPAPYAQGVPVQNQNAFTPPPPPRTGT